MRISFEKLAKNGINFIHSISFRILWVIFSAGATMRSSVVTLFGLNCKLVQNKQQLPLERTKPTNLCIIWRKTRFCKTKCTLSASDWPKQVHSGVIVLPTHSQHCYTHCNICIYTTMTLTSLYITSIPTSHNTWDPFKAGHSALIGDQGQVIAWAGPFLQ